MGAARANAVTALKQWPGHSADRSVVVVSASMPHPSRRGMAPSAAFATIQQAIVTSMCEVAASPEGGVDAHSGHPDAGIVWHPASECSGRQSLNSQVWTAVHKTWH